MTPARVAVMEHCAVCGDVIFKWGTGWVHGTDHVAVPERPDDDPEIPLHRRRLDEDDATLTIDLDNEETP